MKKTKLLTTLVLILSMLLSLAGSAFADTSTPTATGTITIENPVAKQSYYVYRIFDLESFSGDNYSYVLNSEWYDFATQDNINNVYITIEESGDKNYVKWKENADIAAFAKLALSYAKANTNKVSITDGKTPLTNDPVVFSNLKLGYYLIDSSVGALSALTTTNPNVSIREKNELSTVVKKVQENYTGDFGSENSAKIGDTVNFKSEITIGEGAENLVLHDKMDASLTYTVGSVKVYIEQSIVDASNYTIKNELNQDCTFEVTFKNDFISPLTKGTKLLIEYSAVLNANVKIAPASNNNDTWVSFGDGITSTTSTTKTYTTGFDLFKTDADGKVIILATFKLYDVKTGGMPISFVKVSTEDDQNKGLYEYRVATSTDEVSQQVTEINAGLAKVKGLDQAVYYLEETQQPTGYNKLSGRKEVNLTNGSITATTDFFGNERKNVIGEDVSTQGGVQVINRAGTLLPNTGGVGTTIFYIAGILLVTAAAIFGIIKFRKNVLSK